jgi:hypothetical protein
MTRVEKTTDDAAMSAEERTAGARSFIDQEEAPLRSFCQSEAAQEITANTPTNDRADDPFAHGTYPNLWPMSCLSGFPISAPFQSAFRVFRVFRGQLDRRLDPAFVSFVYFVVPFPV